MKSNNISRKYHSRVRILPYQRITDKHIDIIGNDFKIEGQDKAAHKNNKFGLLGRTKKDYQYQI